MKAADRGGLAGGFARAARCYWLTIFPLLRREAQHWQHRARQIPDPALRRQALATHLQKWGNIEGAAAFATLAPHPRRPTVVRALVAIQAAYDYADTLAEQPSSDPQTNGHQLHRALMAALRPDTAHPDYYAHHPHRTDNDYLQSIVDACRAALATLPSHHTAAVPARRAAQRIAVYQSLNHLDDKHEHLKLWAQTQAPTGSEMGWWETAAAAASSLAVLALIAAAAAPTLSAEDADAVERAYYPWIGALHTLLDSLIDYDEDTSSGQPSLIAPYGCPRTAALRIQTLAEQSIDHARALPGGQGHMLILAAMSGLYLCAPQASQPHAHPSTRRVLRAIGNLTAPVMLISHVRRRLHDRYHSRREKN